MLQNQWNNNVFLFTDLPENYMTEDISIESVPNIIQTLCENYEGETTKSCFYCFFFEVRIPF